jgi:hypothetical protein
MRFANRKNLGVAYVITSIVLLVTIVRSWQCWESQNVGNHSTETLHDVCLGIWVVSGALVVLSQIVFIGVALGIKDSAASNTEVTAGASLPDAHASVTKVLILVGGLVVLAIVAVFLFALFNMPS